MSTAWLISKAVGYKWGGAGWIAGKGPGSTQEQCGIAVFRHRGDDYLAVAHEVSNTTTLYRIDRARRAANR